MTAKEKQIKCVLPKVFKHCSLFRNKNSAVTFDFSRGGRRRKVNTSLNPQLITHIVTMRLSEGLPVI